MALLIGEAPHLFAGKLGYFARTYRERFYSGLAALFILAITINAAWEAFRPSVEGQSLDLAIRYRLSSPKPDASIVILDIDERSLALLAPEHGRWPWPRSVLAEAIATLNDGGTKAIVTNIMLSDPDKGNPDGDALFNEVATSADKAIFPMIRLNPENDTKSEVTTKMIPGVRFERPEVESAHLAVLFPYFPGTHSRLGASNLTVDEDGVVRRYSVWMREKGFSLPSIAFRAARLVKPEQAEMTTDEIILNWRNKNGNYQRISFADFYDAMNGRGSLPLDSMKDMIVVIGASAPGISTVKGTSSSPIMDDNEIIATAIDDIVNDTHLRTLPGWVVSIITVIFILLLMGSFVREMSSAKLNTLFGVGQSGLVIFTVASASYTVYLIDLSQCFFVGFAYFMVAKLYSSIDSSASRGESLFTTHAFIQETSNRFLIFGFDQHETKPRDLRITKRELERRFGVQRTFQIENAFANNNIFGSICQNFSFYVIFFRAVELNEGIGVTTGSATPFPELRRISGHSVIKEINPAMLGDRNLLNKALVKAMLGIAEEVVEAGAAETTHVDLPVPSGQA